uniref:Transmembrane protein n=1 Tax=Knipowitschia caucasica TaxID=637954 RepID=A0AAV2MR64_KNICA
MGGSWFVWVGGVVVIGWVEDCIGVGVVGGGCVCGGVFGGMGCVGRVVFEVVVGWIRWGDLIMNILMGVWGYLEGVVVKGCGGDEEVV